MRLRWINRISGRRVDRPPGGASLARRTIEEVDAMRLHAHAWATAAATLALMVIGSLVHGTGSSLACPDWPLCRGTAFPAMVNGVQFEHTHRLTAAVVVVLTASLLARLLRTGDRAARRLSGVALGLVGVQAALGAFTVVYRLPPAVSIAHLATSMVFLTVLVLLATRLTPRRARLITNDARSWTAAAAGLVFGQIVLGGAVRHLGAALACTGVPLCTGVAWPGAWPGQLHMIHRATGLLALVAVFGASVATFRGARSSWGRTAALAPAAVALAQVGLGTGVVLAYAPLVLVTLHHAGGALLLGSLTLGWGLAGPAASLLPEPGPRPFASQISSRAPGPERAVDRA
jgi:heme A synthase